MVQATTTNLEMDARTSRFASQFTRFFAVGAGLLLLAGCAVKVIDRTPATFSENPSQVYTITAEVPAPSGIVRKGSLKPAVVIDGQSFAMRKSDLGRDMWEYEYRLPPGRTEGAYYVLVSYETESNGRIEPREAWSELKHFKVANRYSLSLDASRAPVGAQVTILGRGFNPGDVVYVGEQAAQTSFRSANSLAFTVPALPAGRNYRVNVGAPGAGLDVGTLRIDEGTLTVTPDSLSLQSGERRRLVFTIPSEAPAGGLVLDVTTDVAASVIMPEVTIPEGARSINVAVQGGQPGVGSIFVSAPGFGEIMIPVSVSAR